MKTLIGILQQVTKYTGLDLRLNSLSYGPVHLEKIEGDKIIVTDFFGKQYEFDINGRIHPKGRCLLYPEDNSRWDDYLKKVTSSYYDSKLKTGEVCLVKEEETGNWILAVYERKTEDGQGYYAKRGLETERFMYCINYSENPSYLGRSMFPDWLIPDDEDEILTN